VNKIHYSEMIPVGIVYDIKGKVRTDQSQRTACGIYDYYANLVSGDMAKVTCKRCKKKKP
jgi:hypothetical protein